VGTWAWVLPLPTSYGSDLALLVLCAVQHDVAKAGPVSLARRLVACGARLEAKNRS